MRVCVNTKTTEKHINTVRNLNFKMGQVVNHYRGLYGTLRKEYKENIIMQIINRKQACSNAKFSVSKIHARKPSVDVNTAKGNHIKFIYPNKEQCKGVRKQCVL